MSVCLCVYLCVWLLLGLISFIVLSFLCCCLMRNKLYIRSLQTTATFKSHLKTYPFTQSYIWVSPTTKRTSVPQIQAHFFRFFRSTNLQKIILSSSTFFLLCALQSATSRQTGTQPWPQHQATKHSPVLCASSQEFGLRLFLTQNSQVLVIQ